MWLQRVILLLLVGAIIADSAPTLTENKSPTENNFGCKTITEYKHDNPKIEKGLNRILSADEPCQFPFRNNGKTYYGCTHDPMPGKFGRFSPLLDGRPWCATKTDTDKNIILSRGGLGVCDSSTCQLPSKFCGVPGDTHYPWLVSLGWWKNDGWIEECGGSIITSKHVLTLASCMDRLSSNKHEPRVKMTEANDLKITEMKKHPRYSDGLDVGIAIAEEEFIFTNTVRPVCLPNFPDDPVSKSRTLILQQFVSDPEENTMQLNQKEITEELCKGNIKGITCIEPRDLRVTEGSPVVKMVTQTARRKEYYVQEFISKNQMEMVKISERFILSWIQNITDTAPVLMVYGGKAKDGTPNYSTEVDIVTGNPNICYKVNKAKAERWTWTMEDGTEQSSWAFEAKQYNVAKNEIKDSGQYFIQAIGMAGHFVNDAVILCGGYYGAFESEICFQFDFEFNRWKQITSMNYPRHFATAELDNDGNMWMIGGRKIHNDFDVSNAAPDSEVYKIDSKEWIPNAPLPEELKHGGVTDHCTVRLNSTHVMLISGKKQGFFFEDANAEQTGFGTKETAGGGFPVNKAWMFGRETWIEVADLSIPRLQAACSILPDERDSSVKVLVVGGCKGSCNFLPPMSSTEIYDPDTNKWTKAADLPIPIFGGSLQLLNNIPTLIGGTSRYAGGYDQTDVLYQYHVDKNEWIPLDFKLNEPVAFSAVIPVPKDYLQSC